MNMFKARLTYGTEYNIKSLNVSLPSCCKNSTVSPHRKAGFSQK
ncbi:hypothetical protein [Paenibacillus guangzhouensis]|nr:hypothetical protein [Paenibacillus guangzhouensis]